MKISLRGSGHIFRSKVHECEVTKIPTEKKRYTKFGFRAAIKVPVWPTALPGSNYLDIPGLFELGLLKSGKRGPEVAMKSMKYTE